MKKTGIKPTEEKIAMLALLFDRINAVKFGRFRLRLHETRPDEPLSPIYLDLRLLRSFPQVMIYAADILTGLIIEQLGGMQIDRMVDIPTAITPVVSVMSSRTEVGMISLRKDKKSHGITAAIDGDWRAGMRVAVIDDLLTAGFTKLETIEALSNEGLAIAGLFVLVDRSNGGIEAVQRQIGCPLRAVITMEQLLDVLVEEKRISPDQRAEVLAYRPLLQ